MAMGRYEDYILACILIVHITGEEPYFPFEEQDYAEPATFIKQYAIEA